MAGATNKAMKAAGLPARTIERVRVARGAGMTVRSAIQRAQAHEMPLGRAGKNAAALTGWEKAAAGVKSEPSPTRAPLQRPGLDKMRASKANVAALREQRDARRERMGRMRRRVEFARETKRLKESFTPEHQRAIDKAEMGYGPKQARFAAKMGLRDAKGYVRDARRAVEQAHNAIRFGQEVALTRKPESFRAELGMRIHQFMRDAKTAREHLSAVKDRLTMANAARTAARKERRHATLVNEGRALRDMAEANFPLTRRTAQKEYGFTGISKASGPSTLGKRGAFSSAKHLAKRLALGEQLAQRILSGGAKTMGPRFIRNLEAIQKMAPKRAAPIVRR